MRVVALLAWYDEPAGWLQRCVKSLAEIPVDRVVAVDGAYALFPGGRPCSHPDQAAMVRAAADSIGVPATVHTPETVWAGNELEKRNHMFRLAETHTTEQDWYLVIDADEFVTVAPGDLKARLAGSPFDVAAVTLTEPGHPLGPLVFPTHPKLFRAVRGLRAVGDHFTYRTPDGRNLWGDAKRARLEPRLDLTDLTVEHHKELRHPDRRQAAMGYYHARDTAGVENLPADRNVLAA